jgi:hypothetical protein
MGRDNLEGTKQKVFEFKEMLLKKVNSLENRANELKEVWMRSH